MEFIPVNTPLLDGNEKNIYVNALIQDGYPRKDHLLKDWRAVWQITSDESMALLSAMVLLL